jgi:hypothetical protein
MKKILVVPIIVSLIGCSTIRNPTLTESAVLDTVTTHIGLNNGLVEKNPIGLVGATIGKILIITYTNNLKDPKQKKDIELTGSSIWTAASVNNALLILGATGPFSIISGIIVGILIYTNPKNSTDTASE